MWRILEETARDHGAELFCRMHSFICLFIYFYLFWEVEDMRHFQCEEVSKYAHTHTNICVFFVMTVRLWLQKYAHGNKQNN